MKILLIGTGAVGSFFGGKIARSSNADITFFSRGESYKQIKDNGLSIKSSIEDSFSTKVSIVETLTSNPNYDLVIIATKSYDVKGLLSNLPPVLFEKAYFMTTQNGLSTEDLLLKFIPEDRLIPASVFVGVKKTSGNTVYHMGGGRFQFGSYDKQEKTGFLEELYNILEKASIDVNFSLDIMKLKWGKITWNAAYNPISTITQLELGSLVQSKYGTSLIRASMNETALIAKAYGYNISKSFIEKQIDLPKNLYTFKTSMLQDYINDRPLELEGMLGDLVNKAKKHNIDSPVNNYCYSMLNLLLEAKEKAKKLS